MQSNIASGVSTSSHPKPYALISPDCRLLAELLDSTCLRIYHLVDDQWGAALQQLELPHILEARPRIRNSGWQTGGRRLAIPFDGGTP